jgi:hypothetical protein
MVVKSLNDLSITIHEIGKKYDIKNFVTEFKSSIKEVNNQAWDEIDALRPTDVGESTPLEKIMLLSSILNDEELQKVVKISEKLNTKYHYDNFSKECETVRKAFLESRNDYFSVKAVNGSKSNDVGGLNSYVELTGMSDLMLGSWIRKILERIYPYSLDIEYEDMNGKIVKTKIIHRQPVITENYVDCPLISRYHGTNGYDQFLLQSFYNSEKNKWVYIPVRLIVNLSSPDGINLDDLDLPDD